MILHRLLPITDWIRTYTRADLIADLKAGATVGVLLIPQAMAYAALAGVPPITGLYASMISLIVYAVFGTSRSISVAPVAIDSLLTATAVAPLAHGDAGRYLALASATAVVAGALQALAGVARLGALVNFVSAPVISGFTTTAALTIAATQLKDLLGLDLTAPATTLAQALRGIVPALGTVDAGTTLLGIATILALVALRRAAPNLPGPLLAVSGVTVVVWAAGWGPHLQLVGSVPAGLPVPGWPPVGVTDIRALLPSAAAIALISYVESISTGTAFARRTRSRVDPDQELIAVGLANTAAGLCHGFPVAGGFSRGAVNVNAGARTPMSGVIASVLIVVALFSATGLLALLPKVALAAVMMVAVAGLIDLKGALAIWRVRRSDLAALVVTAVATTFLGPAAGLGVGVGVSLALFLRHSARPHLPELGQIPGEPVFRNVSRHEVLTDPALVVVRVDAPLSFTGARPIADRIGELVRRRPEARWLVIDASAINTADFTGVEMLGTLCTDLEAAGVTTHLAALRGPVRDILSREATFRGLEAAGRVHQTVADAVAALGVTPTVRRLPHPAAPPGPSGPVRLSTNDQAEHP